MSNIKNWVLFHLPSDGSWKISKVRSDVIRNELCSNGLAEEDLNPLGIGVGIVYGYRLTEDGIKASNALRSVGK